MMDDSEKDDLINQVVASISKAERKIMDDFAKVYLAALSLDGKDLAELLRNGNLRLNRKDPGLWDEFTYQYWYSIDLND